MNVVSRDIWSVIYIHDVTHVYDITRPCFESQFLLLLSCVVGAARGGARLLIIVVTGLANHSSLYVSSLPQLFEVVLKRSIGSLASASFIVYD